MDDANVPVRSSLVHKIAFALRQYSLVASLASVPRFLEQDGSRVRGYAQNALVSEESILCQGQVLQRDRVRGCVCVVGRRC